MARGDFRQRVIFELVDKASKGVKKVGKGLKGLASSTKVLAGLGVALTAVIALGVKLSRVLKAAATAAGIQETAIRKLNISLARTGSVEKYSAALQAQASRLQELGQAGDEALIASQSLLAEMGVAPARLAAATEAALDLSAALGISLESATRNIARTTSGLAGELGELIPELRLMQEAGTLAGEGIEFLLEKFSGAAAGQVDTFTSAVTRQKSALGDLSEVLGEGQTDAGIVAAMNAFTRSVQNAGDALSGSQMNEFLSDTKEASIDAKTAMLDWAVGAAQVFGLLKSGSQVIEEQAEEWLKLRESTLKNRAEAKLMEEGEKAIAAAVKLVGDRLEAQAAAWEELFGNTDAFNASVTQLGVTLESDFNEALEKNVELLEQADNRLRQGIITRLDYDNITQAIALSERELNDELHGSVTVLDQLALRYETGAVAANRFAAATDSATRSALNFQTVAGQGSATSVTSDEVNLRSGTDRFSEGKVGFVSGGRFQFRGGSRLLVED